MNREEFEQRQTDSSQEPNDRGDLEDGLGSAPMPKSALMQKQVGALQIHYWVAMPEPESHLFEVRLHLTGWNQNLSSLDLKMPVWTPGSYLVREYSRHLQNFSALAGNGSPLPWKKVSKNHWQVDPQGQLELTVCYRVYANELTVRTNHLDGTHGYFNGAALFLYIPGFERHPIDVTIVPPRTDWRVVTPLPGVTNQDNTYRAEDFDTLVDSPFEVGAHQLYEFEAYGKPHQLAVWGQGNLQPERLLTDMQKVIQTEGDLFGGVPYDRYLFCCIWRRRDLEG